MQSSSSFFKKSQIITSLAHRISVQLHGNEEQSSPVQKKEKNHNIIRYNIQANHIKQVHLQSRALAGQQLSVSEDNIQAP
jgi:hypothetical protein